MDSAWIAASAAVAAAVVGPTAAVYIARLQNRSAASIARRQINASLISGNRQAWIDRLRDSIADFQSVLYNLGFRGGSSYDRASDDERFQGAVQLRSRIALLINPLELDHKQLLILMDKALSVAYTAGEGSRQEMAMAQAEITDTAQRLLKREWERVKAGEPEMDGRKRRLTASKPSELTHSDV